MNSPESNLVLKCGHCRGSDDRSPTKACVRCVKLLKQEKQTYPSGHEPDFKTIKQPMRIESQGHGVNGIVQVLKVDEEFFDFGATKALDDGGSTRGPVQLR